MEDYYKRVEKLKELIDDLIKNKEYNKVSKFHAWMFDVTVAFLFPYLKRD